MSQSKHFHTFEPLCFRLTPPPQKKNLKIKTIPQCNEPHIKYRDYIQQTIKIGS